MSVKPSPVTPVPAASLVLLRDRPQGGVQTLLIQRHRQSRFAAGDFVFPGGKVEVGDTSAPTAADEALAYQVGAIRETFEEVGVLLADDAAGRPVDVAAPRFVEYRRACQRDHGAFWAMLRAERLAPATQRLVYFAHWITPEEHPLRFDTRFFAAPMPGGQEPSADEREIVAVRWLAPDEALAAQAGGDITLRLPTVKNLMLLAAAPSVAAVLETLRGLRVSAIRPRLVGDGAARRAILPGEPGYY